MRHELDFSKQRIQRLPIEEQVYYAYDSGGTKSVPGLCVRVSTTGIKSFQLYKKFRGKPMRITLGRFPDITVEQARKKSEQEKAKMLDGIDPNQAKRARREKGITLHEAFTDYMDGRQCAETTRSNYYSVMKIYFKSWQSKPLKEITRAMVHSHYLTSCKHSETGANKALRLLRAIFNYAMDTYLNEKGEPVLQDNPVKEINRKKAWRKETPRSGTIKTEQFKAWFSATEKLDPVLKDYLVFVLLTGLRRREATSLQWDQIDFKNRTLTVTETKNGDPLTLPLSDYLEAMLIQRQQATESPWVFPSEFSKSGHLEEPKAATKRIYEISGVQATVHDLRRTFASVGANDAGISTYALKALLNHRQSSDVTGTHYVNIEIERLREPMQKITDYILKAAGIKRTATIHALPTKTKTID